MTHGNATDGELAPERGQLLDANKAQTNERGAEDEQAADEETEARGKDGGQHESDDGFDAKWHSKRENCAPFTFNRMSGRR